MANMTGPRKIIDLDGSPENNYKKFKDDALHLWKNRLWHWERLGCISCASEDAEDYRSYTFRADDDHNTFVCLKHGDLEEVNIEVIRAFTIRIGEITRNGMVTKTDSILFPRSLANEERERIINNLFNEMEVVERTSAQDEESDEIT